MNPIMLKDRKTQINENVTSHFRKTSDDKKLSFDWVLLKSVTLIFQSLVLFSLSLMNISLAFFLGAVTIPVSLMVHPTENR